MFCGCGTCTSTVYPRVYGETAEEAARQAYVEGLSPRVRGNRMGQARRARRSGSIPACTGKPPPASATGRDVPVYPRVYGETSRRLWRGMDVQGLSPRVRGNHGQQVPRPIRSRSIPACTGKPMWDWTWGDRCRVYPRVYGETVYTVASGFYWRGLSPRVRGNHRGMGRSMTCLGSIPACTGKPSAQRASCCANKVYPRVYGETQLRRAAFAGGEGLSPRVRGNQVDAEEAGDVERSIPACTGKPDRATPWPGEEGVYPRVYGETAAQRIPSYADLGLSPRVRGNLQNLELHPPKLRSIPACTGKPGAGINHRGHPRVYPRVYGETRNNLFAHQGDDGLSPRVRGNRVDKPDQAAHVGSIPACTGKPGCGR